MDRKEIDHCWSPSPKGIEGGGAAAEAAALKWLINEIGGRGDRARQRGMEKGPLSGFVRSFSSASSPSSSSSSRGQFGGYGQGFSIRQLSSSTNA